VGRTEGNRSDVLKSEGAHWETPQRSQRVKGWKIINALHHSPRSAREKRVHLLAQGVLYKYRLGISISKIQNP
jgi:hypothetical protein